MIYDVIGVNEDVGENGRVFYFLWHKSGTATIAFTKIFQKNYDMYVTLSNNKSTLLMRFAFRALGCFIIDGSRHKGYLGSVKEILNIMSCKKNVAICVTPDGPRGPDMQIQDATLFKIAKRYGVQIRFLCPLSENIFEFNTWEKIYLLKPFSRGFLLNQVVITKDELEKFSPDELRQLCEERMFEAFSRLRKMCNLPNVVQGAVKKSRYQKERD
ncbi:DUF374 domain-containing protein [Candidatus Deianiraea vastatrix]|nr:DUF374 domain-containing protein [Candidatus Deianiraea vastatrix]